MKKQSGVTMVALVITIIVLVVLAGVTISLVVGNSGVLSKTSDAVLSSKEGQANEELSMAWSSATTKYWADWVNNSQISMSDYLTKAALDPYFSDGFLLEDPVLHDDGIYTAKYELGGAIYDFTIDVTGHATNIGTTYVGAPVPSIPAAIGTATNADKYGYKVQGYSASTGYTGAWRLFYQDTNYTYIITDELVGSYNKPNDYFGTTITSGADMSQVGQNLNPTIKSLFTESYTGDGMKATVWLTNPECWLEFKDTAGKALFAIGSPTADLFVASFNATAEAAGKNLIQTEVGAYGISFTGINSNSIDNRNNGIYGDTTNSYDTTWWLAAPKENLAGQLWVDGGTGLSGHGTDVRAINVRPVVCIPTADFHYTLLDE